MVHHNCIRRSQCLLTAVLAASVLSSPLTLVGDGVTEQTHLAAIMRQFDMIDRLAVHSASLPRPDDVRYHFDYWHLQKDIERVNQGIRDYLTPAATATRPSGAVG